MAQRVFEVPFITAAKGCPDFEPDDSKVAMMIVVKLGVRNGVAVMAPGPYEYEVGCEKHDGKLIPTLINKTAQADAA